MYLAWIFLVVLFVILFLISVMIVKHYIDPAESYKIINVSVTISLVLSLICLLLIPIDVFVIARSTQELSTLDFQIDKDSIQTLFRYCYLALLAFTFIILPFNYFYGEEQSLDFENDTDLDYEKGDFGIKIKQASKNTFFFMIILFALLTLGLVFRPADKTSLEQGKDVDWVKQLFDVDHAGEAAVSFSLATVISFGNLFWILYASYGMAYLPVFLIKGTKSLEQEKSEVDNDLGQIRERYRSIQERYARQHSQITQNDQRTLAHLRRQERLLNARSERISEQQGLNSQTLQKLLKLISPFRVLIGFACLALSAMVFWSLALTMWDRFTNSKCGFQCGYIVDRKQIFNPLDTLLVESSNFFPLDYLLFFILSLYIFICVLYGIIKFGFSFFCLKGFELQRGQTVPQALVVTAFIMNISILVLSSQMITLSPQYTTFGNQLYSQNTQCTLQLINVNTKHICQMSNTSSFYNKISLSFPMFAIIGFCTNVSFLLLELIFLLISLFSQRSSQFDDVDDVDLEEESSQLLVNQ